MEFANNIKGKMPQIVQNISKTQFMIWGGILVLFIIAAIFVYINYIKPQLADMEYKANYEFDKTIQDKGGKKADIRKHVDLYLFWACWCPNSNKDGPTGEKLHEMWETLQEKVKNKEISFKNFDITFHTIQEKDDNFKSEEEKLVGKDNIEGFPSIFMKYTQMIDNKDQEFVCEFDAMPTLENITEFIGDNLRSSAACKSKK